MGFLKMLFNVYDAEGKHEAMRMSYRKHMKEASSAGIEPEGQHFSSIYGAFVTRYRLSGRAVNEIFHTGEISLILCMDSTVAVESLAKYIVAIEKPSHAKIDWLQMLINVSLCNPARGEAGIEAQKMEATSMFGVENSYHWINWLSQETKRTLNVIAQSELST